MGIHAFVGWLVMEAGSPGNMFNVKWLRVSKGSIGLWQEVGRIARLVWRRSCLMLSMLAGRFLARLCMPG